MTYLQDESVFTTKERTGLTIFLGAVVVLTVFDVYEDIYEGASMQHIIPEVAIILFASAAVVYLSLMMARNRKTSLITSLQELKDAQKISSQWKESAQMYKKGITSAIETEMNKWELTPAEKDIAFLLLKGFSIKEIAVLRSTSERTVRHQSTLIYKKSGLSGRAQLSAYFLEDILGPSQALKD